MSLVYACEQRVERRADHEAASLEDVAMVVANWAEVDPLAEGHQVGKRGADVSIDVIEVAGKGIWQLKLAHPDEQDSSLRWCVTVTIVSDGETRVATRLEQQRPGGSVVAVRTHPRPPGCIRAVMESPIVCAVDGGREMTAEAWVVNADEAQELARLVMSVDRHLPVIAFTPRDDDVFDGGLLAERLPGLAHVVLVKSETSWSLQTLIPPGFAVYGGAVRVWWPGIRADTPDLAKWDHKLWPGDVSARRISDECVDLVVAAGLVAITVDERVAEVQAERRRIEMGRLRSEVESAVSSRESVRVAQELDQMEELVKTYEVEARDARERAAKAEQDRDYWRQECARLRARGRTTAETEEADDADLFRRDLDDEVNSRGTIQGARLRPYTLGPRFLDTVRNHGDRYHSRILRACADVVMGAPDLLNRIDDHALRKGAGPNDAQLRRESDDATARRCAIEQNTPAARRLHYWVMPEGSVEFASVNVHDDPSIPEG